MEALIRVRTLQTFWQRFWGVQGVKNAFKPVFIPACQVVHTFGVRQSLHLLWLSKTRHIIHIDKAVPPCAIKSCRAADSVVEIAASNSVHKYRIGQKLKLKGQALVEAAFVMPLLFLLLFGFIELGLLLHAQQRLTYVAQYATQVGSLTNHDGKITGAVAEFFPVTSPAVSIVSTSAITNQTINPTNRRYSDFLAVQLQQPYQLNIPFLPVELFDLTAEARARVLCQNSNPPFQCD